MVRITYKELKPNGWLVNNKPILALEKLLTVTIFKSFEFVIENEAEELSRGKGKTLSDAKKLVKEALKALGVTFTDEVRNREPKSPEVGLTD